MEKTWLVMFMRRIYVRNKPYICDPLYSVCYLPDFIWDVIPCPELQRLREVRLCNINSFCLTGGANINRYEHAIGTCYLAQECLDSWPLLNPISKKEQELLLLAALLHDVTSAAFGHSVEYIESKEGFEHEKAFEHVVVGEKGASYRYKSATLEPIFFGTPRELLSKLAKEDLETIGEIIAGKGRFGPLINSSMDLDNIDNVFRLGYHIGLVKSGEVALKLARSLYTENGKLIVRKETVPLVEEWYKVRRKLYLLLLLNPEEFSAKCMLTEAIELAKMKDIRPFNWSDVDYEVLQKLNKIAPIQKTVKERLFKLNINYKAELNSSIVTKQLQEEFKRNGIDVTSFEFTTEPRENGWIIRNKAREYFIKERDGELIVYKPTTKSFEISLVISRLMRGDLYGCIGIFSTSKTDKYSIFADPEEKIEIEDEISRKLRKFGGRLKSAMVALHPISDISKTERQVCIQTDDGRIIQIGKSSNQLLIGVFFKNADLGMHKISNLPRDIMRKIRQQISIFLSDILGDPNLEEVELYGELTECLEE